MDFQLIDRAATEFINGLSGRSAFIDTLIAALSFYGVYAIVIAVAVRWWFVGGGDKLHERYLAVLCGLSAALGLLMNQGILLFVQRMRPYDAGVTHLIVTPSADPSFPSDHATLAFAVAFAFLAVGARRGWVYFVAAVAIAVSRVYVGIHYVSDVLGGTATALVAATLCVALIGRDALIMRTLVRIL